MSKAELISRADNVARLRVALEPAEVDKVYKGLYRAYAERINVPGFRKGKVPPNVLRQRIGSAVLDEEAAEHLKEQAINLALDELKLTPRRGDPVWHQDAEIREGQPAEYEVSLPVLPDVKLPDYREFKLQVQRVPVDEQLKQRYRQRLLERFTQQEDKDGQAEPGDMLRIAFGSVLAATGEAAPFEHEGMPYVLGQDGNLPGWDEQLAGARAGEQRVFDYAMPADFADQRIAGKPLKVSVTVNAVQLIKQPELTEEFIKEQLHMNSLEEFEQYVDSTLAREVDVQLEQRKREAALGALAEQLEAEITPNMVADELDGMLKDNDRTLRNIDSSLDQYLTEKGQSIAEYRASLEEAAHRRIRVFLAVREIAEREQLNATSEDFSRYAYFLMQREGVTPEQFRQLLGYPEFVSETTYQIVREKVLEHLVSSASFEVTDLAQAPAAG